MAASRRRIAALIALAFVGGPSTVGCKAGNKITEIIPPATAEFIEETVPPAVSSHVRLRKVAVNGGRIILEVVAREVDEPVTGIAIKLTYPNAFSKFVDCEDGDLFPPGRCFFAEPAEGSGEVFVGRSITAPESGVSVTGDRVIVRLEFLVFGEGKGRIEFEGQNLGGGDATALLDANGDPIFVQWFSGNLQGTR